LRVSGFSFILATIPKIEIIEVIEVIEVMAAWKFEPESGVKEQILNAWESLTGSQNDEKCSARRQYRRRRGLDSEPRAGQIGAALLFNPAWPAALNGATREHIELPLLTSSSVWYDAGVECRFNDTIIENCRGGEQCLIEHTISGFCCC
jgi:hypothetical protein